MIMRAAILNKAIQFVLYDVSDDRTNSKVGLAYLVCATCQVIGFGDILQVYLSRTFKLSLGFMMTYILTSGSVLLFATGFPLLTIRWDRLDFIS